MSSSRNPFQHHPNYATELDMALKSPLMPSPTGPGFSPTFSPRSDSTNSPAHRAVFDGLKKRLSGRSDSLAPQSSPFSPQVEPSPVDSNGTENTDIEEGEQEESSQYRLPAPPSDEDSRSAGMKSSGRRSVEPDPEVKIDTDIPPRTQPDSVDDAPSSVIHAPEGFKGFDELKSTQQSPSSNSEHTVVSPTARSPSTPEAIERNPADKKSAAISPVNTDLPKFMDRSTPRAQTRPEEDDTNTLRRNRRESDLEDIPESNDTSNQNSKPYGPRAFPHAASASNAMRSSLEIAEEEVAALRSALSECWTLCNTLANLSSSHRQRTFQFSGRQAVQEQAWQTCWRLCRELYASRDKYDVTQVMPTLELCREFCQALFDVRQKEDEATDSVLRVSFELNNHLYNTHDRSLPEAFNERTLDFYITLCHRLMRQRTSLPQETDSLLRACWSMAEMLFNMRQSNREGRKPDEELLGSAVQACWELCDLFREGWTQVRPERGTPRPSKMTFVGSKISVQSSSSHSDAQSSSSLSGQQYHDASAIPPETPTTIFDDGTTDASSPDFESVPNILVLGPGSATSGSARQSHHERWTSSASVLSGYSSTSSQQTSSTATAENEQVHLTRLRYLLLRAAANLGYDRSSGQQLTAYVTRLSDTSFGTLPWQMKVLTYYKKLVMGDKSMLSAHGMPARRLTASEVAKSVKWLGDGSQWVWMRDLYMLVFGFGIEEADRKSASFQV